MSTQNETSFFDSKTIAAVVLVGALFFGWQKYLEYKYPDFYKKSEIEKAQNDKATHSDAVSGNANVTSQNTTESSNKIDSLTVSKDNSAPKIAPNEKTENIELDRLNLSISNQGFAFKKIELPGYKDREHNPIKFGPDAESEGVFEIRLIGENTPLSFSFENPRGAQESFQIGEPIVGLARQGETVFEQRLTYQKDSKSFLHQIKITNAGPQFRGFEILFADKKKPHVGASIFNPSLEYQEFVVKHQGKTEHIAASKENEEFNKNFDLVTFASIGSQYFTMLLFDQSPLSPSVEIVSPKQGNIEAKLKYVVSSVQPEMNFTLKSFVGPKSIDELKAIDPELSDIINLGFFSSIGKILLSTLKWFYQFVNNWGVAIILLTLLVRLLVMPFNIASYKSMKKMQKIQPLLQSIRERYKNDPAAMNRETMAVMRDQKVNPLGGCLPMLLQMPVFFALYQALGQSIELYQAPFMLWIQDLSVKDPFYILPVLMGVTMFIQQKITPTTMDPQQAKILQWMPLLFSVFMISLPAGLTLYIFVSTLFGVVQQRLFMSDKIDKGLQTQKT